jgi:hypothetical protein
MAMTQAIGSNADLSHRLLRHVLLAVVLLAAMLVAIVGGSSSESEAAFAPVQVSAVSHDSGPAAPHAPAATLR